MKIFELIKGIKAAKVQGLKLNTYCASVKAIKGTLRSMIFKYWNRVLVPIQAKIITVSRDNRVAGIFNIVDNSNCLKYHFTQKLIKMWVTENNLYNSANKAGFTVVVL